MKHRETADTLPPLQRGASTDVRNPSKNGGRDAGLSLNAGDDEPVLNGRAKDASPATTLASAGKLPVTSLLICLWGLGSLIWMAIILCRVRRFHRHIGELKLPSDELLRAAAGLADRIGLTAPPRIRIVDAPIAPMVWPLGRRCTVLLPMRLVAELTSNQLQTVLAHELIHVKRRDHWVRFLEVLVGVVYWWHPLIWWVKREIQSAEEDCCDADVLQLLTDRQREYGEALLRTVELTSGVRSPMLASVFGNSPSLRRRIQKILEGRCQKPLSSCAKLVLLLFAVAILPLTAWGVMAEEKSNSSVNAHPRQVGGQSEGRGTSRARLVGGEKSLAAASARQPAVTAPEAHPSNRADDSIYANLSIKKTGRIINFVAAIDPTTGKCRKIADGGSFLRVSPDGGKLAYRLGDSTWVRSLLKPDEAHQVASFYCKPAWLPNGKQLLATRWQRIDKKAFSESNWLLSADGSKSPMKVSVPATDSIEDVSSDGTWILTVSSRDKGKGWQVYRMMRDGKNAQRLTQLGSTNVAPRFSPDGKRICYTRLERGALTLDVMEVRSQQVREVMRSARGNPIGVDAACWSPDGKRLAVIVFDWKYSKNGKRYLDMHGGHNYRLVIVDVYGKEKPKELRLQFGEAEILDIKSPDWR